MRSHWDILRAVPQMHLRRQDPLPEHRRRKQLHFRWPCHSAGTCCYMEMRNCCRNRNCRGTCRWWDWVRSTTRMWSRGCPTSSPRSHLQWCWRCRPRPHRNRRPCHCLRWHPETNPAAPSWSWHCDFFRLIYDPVEDICVRFHILLE